VGVTSVRREGPDRLRSCGNNMGHMVYPPLSNKFEYPKGRIVRAYALKNT
jgi:hypothetical protein